MAEWIELAIGLVLLVLLIAAAGGWLRKELVPDGWLMLTDGTSLVRTAGPLEVVPGEWIRIGTEAVQVVTVHDPTTFSVRRPLAWKWQWKFGRRGEF